MYKFALIITYILANYICYYKFFLEEINLFVHYFYELIIGLSNATQN